ncbi:hypothetical protein KAU08_01555 [bacterium]|nr:hypothetical protein [bacterium]
MTKKKISKPRNTIKYRQKIGRKTVGFGITKDLERREQEHKAEDPRIHLAQEGHRTTKEAAREWESEQTDKWKRHHGKLPPKNKQRGG